MTRDFAEELKGRLYGQVLERYEEKESELVRTTPTDRANAAPSVHRSALERSPLGDGPAPRRNWPSGLRSAKSFWSTRKKAQHVMLMNALRDEAVVNELSPS